MCGNERGRIASIACGYVPPNKYIMSWLVYEWHRQLAPFSVSVSSTCIERNFPAVYLMRLQTLSICDQVFNEHSWTRDNIDGNIKRKKEKNKVRMFSNKRLIKINLNWNWQEGISYCPLAYENRTKTTENRKQSGKELSGLTVLVANRSVAAFAFAGFSQWNGRGCEIGGVWSNSDDPMRDIHMRTSAMAAPPTMKKTKKIFVIVMSALMYVICEINCIYYLNCILRSCCTEFWHSSLSLQMNGKNSRTIFFSLFSTSRFTTNQFSMVAISNVINFNFQLTGWHWLVRRRFKRWHRLRLQCLIEFRQTGAGRHLCDGQKSSVQTDDGDFDAIAWIRIHSDGGVRRGCDFECMRFARRPCDP